MVTCHGQGGNQLWDVTSWGGLRHRASELCVESPGGQAGAELLLSECNPASEAQKWDFEFDNDNP